MRRGLRAVVGSLPVRIAILTLSVPEVLVLRVPDPSDRTPCHSFG
ncbi:hypothetical protein [Streptomyces pseudogriseolus]